jgi:hypothetical protein
MVVTVVGDDGGAAGGGFAEHGGGCPLVTGEPALPIVVAPAGELGEATPDAGLVVWVQPAAPATTTTAIAERRARRNFRTDIEITVLKPGLFVFQAVTAGGRPESKHNATAPRRAANQPSPITCTLSVVSPQPQLRHALAMIGHLAWSHNSSARRGTQQWPRTAQTKCG